MTTTQSIRPIEPPYPPEVDDIFATYPKRDGYILNLFRVFANSVRFLRKGTLNLLDRDSPLLMREREVVILRVCANNYCEYEWGVHVGAFAEHVGFSETQIEATCLGNSSDACWSAREQTLLCVVDELCSHSKLALETAEAFSNLWSIEQQLEVFALCGNYHTVTFVANNTELELEDFAARFPQLHYAPSLRESAA